MIFDYDKLYCDFKKLCSDTNFSFTDIRSKKRNACIVDARQYVAKKLRDMGYSYPKIGKVMKKDHTSIMHLVKNRNRDLTR